MKTVQMTIDDELLKAVDGVANQLHTTRSAFTREALREALAKHDASRLEEKHRIGYERFPVGKDEFAVWETEQEWGDE
jgi:CopG family transcriptional regulator / antitoxin EndoAI